MEGIIGLGNGQDFCCLDVVSFIAVDELQLCRFTLEFKAEGKAAPAFPSAGEFHALACKFQALCLDEFFGSRKGDKPVAAPDEAQEDHSGERIEHVPWAFCLEAI